jgi:hypothetical protein
MVRDAQGQALPNARRQLRNVGIGYAVASTRAGADATYQFTGVLPGNYVVEIVDDAGRVLGLRVASSMQANAALTGLSVSLNSTGGVAGSAAAGGLGAFLASTGGILLPAGLGAGVAAGIVAVTPDASPSR